MKVNKIVLTVLVLISLVAGEKPVKATMSNSIITITQSTNDNTEKYSLADIKLEKEIEANKAWDNYINFRKELKYYEKTFPQLLEYDLSGSSSRYRLKMDNVISKNDNIIANQILHLLNDAYYQYKKAIELKQEADSYEDTFKTFS